MPGSELGPAEEPVPAAHRDRTQRALEVVRIDRHVGIVEEDLQPQASLSYIVECLGEGAARQEALALELLLDPREEGLHPRLAVGEPVAPLAIAGELLGAEVLFDRIEGSDLLERLAHVLGIGGLGLEESAPCVRPALRVGESELLRVAVVGGVAIREQHRARGVLQSLELPGSSASGCPGAYAPGVRT